MVGPAQPMIKEMASRIYIKPVPYALDDVDPKERFITSTGAQFSRRDGAQARPTRRTPADFTGRPLPYALDAMKPGGSSYTTSSSEAYIERDLNVARPAKLANKDFVGRPLPYARDDGVDEADAALKFKKKENRFTQGRPLPYALDEHKPSEAYSTSSGEQYIERDLKQARAAQRVTHDQPYNIVTLTDRPVWKDLNWRWKYD
ncbi:hypothetical protein KFE25_003843 [Diacronema lutheri]|uniref:Uncharacterized protein n=2 Tax=Diacronema lutheri TaxID=2081491 RepID=A0A8J5XQE1_DIALT|nr:hypothetical protein KFE25_003843 [Diacronema lutheri]